MLISLLLFHFIASFLLILCSSVSITTGKRCSTDDDCDLELICNTETNTCTCSKPYFWRNDFHTCFGCAPGWLEFETSKCLLFAISHSPGNTWYEGQTTCQALIAQPIMINTTDEFKALQHKIDYLLNGDNALTATLYFHQGAWVKINNEWIESYTWCNNDKKHDLLKCVQIRQNNITNTICLQYVSCNEQSHFICEASPLIQSELEKNMVDTKRLERSDNNEEIMARVLTKPTVGLTTHATVPTPAKITTKTTVKQMIVPTAPRPIPTTKKPSSFSFNNIASILTSGLNAVGQISNAIGNLNGGKTNQQPNVAENSNNQQIPLALSPSDSENSDTNIKNILLYGGLIFGVILLISICIFISIIIFKKKTSSNSTTSIRSTESYTSVVSYE